MKAIDIVNPEPNTALGVWHRWENQLHTSLSLLSIRSRKQIEIKYIEKLDPETCPTNSRGRAACERNGEHSWFNHSMDAAY